MNGAHSWVDILRREAMNAIGSRQHKSTLVCTDYNPKTHAIKGILVPHNVETGWVPLAAIHVGNGFGILVGPKVGSADALDGDMFDVGFDFGDPNTVVARQRLFSSQATPPQVQSGEMLIQHEGGTSAFFDQKKQLTLTHGPSGNTMVFAQDNSVTVTHKPSGSFIQIDKDGNHVHDTKGKSLTIRNTSGVTIDGNLSVNGNTSVSGMASLASGTLGGLGIATV